MYHAIRIKKVSVFDELIECWLTEQMTYVFKNDLILLNFLDRGLCRHSRRVKPNIFTVTK